jgi:hypothetical protein
MLSDRPPPPPKGASKYRTGDSTVYLQYISAVVHPWTSGDALIFVRQGRVGKRYELKYYCRPLHSTIILET